MSDVFDIAIAGGGLVGASLALALRESGQRVALIEPQAPAAPLPPPLAVRSTALAWASRLIFERLGVWPALAAHAAPITQVHVSDRGHLAAARLRADEQGLPALGYVVENHHLQQTLDAALMGAAHLTRIAGEVSEVHPGDARIALRLAAGGAAAGLTARALVLATGAAARVHTRGVRVRVREYGQSAIVANVTVSAPREGVAFERFTRGGPLALLPLPGARYALVQSVLARDADALLALSDAAFLARLRAAFGARLGEFTDIGPRAAFPLSLTRATPQARRRVVLIGNAARALHPVAGQGFNLALRDVAALGGLWSPRGERVADPGDDALLRRFARLRAADQCATVGLTELLLGVFSNRFAPLVAARGAGLIALDLVPPLRRAFARRGMGLAL